MKKVGDERKKSAGAEIGGTFEASALKPVEEDLKGVLKIGKGKVLKFMRVEFIARTKWTEDGPDTSVGQA